MAFLLCVFPSLCLSLSVSFLLLASLVLSFLFFLRASVRGRQPHARDPTAPQPTRKPEDPSLPVTSAAPAAILGRKQAAVMEVAADPCAHLHGGTAGAPTPREERRRRGDLM